MVYWPENIYYLTGYDSLGYFSYQVLIIPKTAEPFAVVRRLERQNVINATWLDECYVYQDGESPVEATIKALKGRGLANKKLGIELDGYFLSVRNYLKLADALNLADTSQLVNRIRLVKSAKEIEYIRAAARAMETGAHAAIKAIRVGATENDVAAALLEASIRAGSEYTGHASLVATGPRSLPPFRHLVGQEDRKGRHSRLRARGLRSSVSRPHGAEHKRRGNRRTSAYDSYATPPSPGSTRVWPLSNPASRRAKWTKSRRQHRHAPVSEIVASAAPATASESGSRRTGAKGAPSALEAVMKPSSNPT